MEIGERIKKIIEEKGFSSASFAREIGVQRSGLSHILSGRNKPGLDFITRVLEKFPDIDAGWLIMGKIAKNGTVEKGGNTSGSKPGINRRIKKVMVFYSDGTFEELPGGEI